MLLADYPGPKAQMHYVGQEHPSFFCDTVELFNTLLRRRAGARGACRLCAGHGQGRLGAPRRPLDRCAKPAFYVLGSKRQGSMGPTIGSFAQEADATKFAAEYGGKVLRFADIKPDMVDLSGGALHDTQM